ncbi:hypothetical protein [Mycolicibacterium arseniciresistens]|uniref:ESX-1 secretion-associated protein n=1 Tax=Mycolicibacterium arseniciresistens TaxID=3062257 RepID=A0ABT8UE01_9MYCO|nr:hypothetical protein [Mycolicibacterium arseniciresistens]MDO3636009.1 hypothetical protein [Mycolicibacterium arseniciresistens]
MNDPLEIEIRPHHQGAAARGALAAIDLDADRVNAALTGIRAEGIDAASAVIAVLWQYLGSALVATMGFDAARRSLERTIAESQAAGDA